MSRCVRTHPFTSVVVLLASGIVAKRQSALHVVSSIDKDCIGVLIWTLQAMGLQKAAARGGLDPWPPGNSRPPGKERHGYASHSMPDDACVRQVWLLVVLSLMGRRLVRS